MRKMSLGAVGGVIGLSGIAAVAIFPVLNLVDKAIYREHLSIFWIMLVTVGVTVVTIIPHYGLYVRRKDKQILVSAALAFALGMLMNGLLVPKHGVTGAAIGTCCAFFALLAIKTWMLSRTKRKSKTRLLHPED